MCFRPKCKENRPRRNRFLIIQLSTDEGVPGALRGWHVTEDQAGAWREMPRMGGPTGRISGWSREADGKRIVKRQESWWRHAIVKIWVTRWIYFKHLLDPL